MVGYSVFICGDEARIMSPGAEIEYVPISAHNYMTMHYMFEFCVDMKDMRAVGYLVKTLLRLEIIE